MTLVEQAKALRDAMDIAAAVLTDEQALSCKILYRTWNSLVHESYVATDVGFRFRYDDQLFKTIQANYTFVDTHIPGTSNTESLFVKIEEPNSAEAVS